VRLAAPTSLINAISRETTRVRLYRAFIEQDFLFLKTSTGLNLLATAHGREFESRAAAASRDALYPSPLPLLRR
jgi:hypothetical protein